MLGLPRCLLVAVSWGVSLSLMVSSGQAAPEADSIGFVLEIKGKWRLVAPKNIEITGGTFLPPGGKIEPVGNDGELTVCLTNSETRVFRQAATLPGLTKLSFSQQFFAALAGKFRGGVVQANSRAGELFQDGVLAIKEDQLDVSPVIAELPPGRWKLQLTKVVPPKASDTSPAASPEKPVTFPLNLESDVAGEVRVTTLPGLYWLELVNPRTNHTVGDSAMVLICAPAEFAAKDKSFSDAVAMTEQWEDDVRDRIAATFLRAYLQTLAELPHAEEAPTAESKGAGAPNNSR